MKSSRVSLPSLPAGIAPVIIWKLSPQGEGYEEGVIEYKLEDIDQEVFYARNEDHMRQMLKRLGVDGVTAEQMKRLRHRRRIRKLWDARRIRRSNSKYREQK